MVPLKSFPADYLPMAGDHRNRYDIYYDILVTLENYSTSTEISRGANVNHGVMSRSVSELGSFDMLKVYDGKVVSHSRQSDGDFVRYIRTDRGRDFVESFGRIKKMLEPALDFSYKQAPE
jgi:predicted transcriptional regulator